MDIVTCGSCGLSWDDAVVTSWTPAPSARCPFEYFHSDDDEPLDASDIPDDFPVRPLETCAACGNVRGVPNPMRYACSDCWDALPRTEEA